MKPRDAAAVLFGLKFARHVFTVREEKLRKPRLQSSKHIGAKQNLTQNSD